jgi:pantetheine-phosphate adenylyltransferase
MSHRKILYAGTFDPLTLGHLDIIRRGAKLADDFIVGVFVNSEKRPMFSLEQRLAMIKDATTDIENARLDSFDGLLADYVNQNNIDIVLRGLRAGVDFEYEISMAQLNTKLYLGGTETIFLMTDPQNSFISSGLVRDVFLRGGDVSEFVPPKVLEYIKKVVAGKGDMNR